MKSNLIGSLIDERYRVDEYVASGGMATVYRVWDLKRNVYLAMKVLHTELSDDPSILKRFEREARALKKLAHPNIVPFYGLNENNGILFLLQEFIDGPTLKKILRDKPNQRLDPQEALTCLKAVSSALGYAHAQGVVHCDIKPENVMIDHGGRIFLADFGIARHAQSSTTTLAGAGTPAYMAPEQIRAEEVSPATDIYALGMMAYELLCGRRPFKGDEPIFNSLPENTAERLRYAQLELTPPDPSTFNPSLPVECTQVVLKALNKHASARYQSVSSFFDDLCHSFGYASSQLPDRLQIDQQYKNEAPPTLPTPERKQPTSKTSIIRFWPIPAAIALILLAYAALTTIPRLTTQNKTIKTQPESSAIIKVPPANDSTAASMPGNQTQPNPLNTLTPTRIIFTPTITASPKPTLTSTPPAKSFLNTIDQAEVIVIPAGEFWMGSDAGEDPYFWGAEAPRHKVNLSAYAIYKFEVTNEMYRACDEANQCPAPAQTSTDKYPNYYTDPGYNKYPVVNVDWTSAQSYCRWAGGRLPTEAEWEKAARGDDMRLFPWGNTPPNEDLLNYCDVNCIEDYRDTSQNDGYAETAPIGSYPQGASPYGVLDMAGNVWEWVSDYWGGAYYKMSPLNDPQGPESDSRRGVRGGAWMKNDESVRVVARFYYQPQRAYPYLGFRCVFETP